MKVYTDAMRRYCQDTFHWIAPEEWEVVVADDVNLLIPQQNNKCDCDVFVILYADLAAANLPLIFDQSHIPDMRVKICQSIVDEMLWYDNTGDDE